MSSPDKDDPGLTRRRQQRLAEARLYLVLDTWPGRGDRERLLHAAAEGGVDIVQLREKTMPDRELLTHASGIATLCRELGMLFIVNDRPDVALDAGADGVHIGQEDMPPVQARALLGGELLVGLSTHAPHEIDSVEERTVDYIGVGPVHATPTKPGRPGVGTELVRYAASNSPVPFFAIGGLHAGNLAEVIDAGAHRACVLRAITDARDPRAAAGELASMLSSGAARAGATTAGS